MPQIRRVQKLTVKAFISLHSPYNTSNKHKTRTGQTPTSRINQQSPRSLLIIGFGELAVLGVVGLVGWVFWVGWWRWRGYLGTAGGFLGVLGGVEGPAGGGVGESEVDEAL